MDICIKIFLCLVVVCFRLCLAGQKCVWAEGQVKCNKDKYRVLNTEIKMLDRDGRWIFDPLDKDDLMGISFPDDEEGHFKIKGCADDQDWIPFYSNDPEPYIQIHHYCNDREKGETVTFGDIIETYVPDTYRWPEPFILDDLTADD